VVECLGHALLPRLQTDDIANFPALQVAQTALPAAAADSTMSYSSEIQFTLDTICPWYRSSAQCQVL
jgi:hypothetical protein